MKSLEAVSRCETREEYSGSDLRSGGTAAEAAAWYGMAVVVTRLAIISSSGSTGAPPAKPGYGFPRSTDDLTYLVVGRNGVAFC